MIPTLTAKKMSNSTLHTHLLIIIKIIRVILRITPTRVAAVTVAATTSTKMAAGVVTKAAPSPIST